MLTAPGSITSRFLSSPRKLALRRPAGGVDFGPLLRLDRFHPDEKLRGGLVSVPVRVAIDELPASGLDYFSFDNFVQRVKMVLDQFVASDNGT